MKIRKMENNKNTNFTSGTSEFNLKETKMNWKKWCRLCGLQDGSDLIPEMLEHLSLLVEKYFFVSVCIVAALLKNPA